MSRRLRKSFLRDNSTALAFTACLLYFRPNQRPYPMKKFSFFLIILFPALLTAQNTWTQKANFGGTARWGAAGFAIGTKGYIGTGYDNTLRNDFWEWDQVTDTWSQKANYGGGNLFEAVGFSVGNKGYIGM